jgi:SAM-dependent methyltransferase
MRETSKMIEKRRKCGHYDKYFQGNGIDIGCGDDPLIVDAPNTIRFFDTPHGDAQYLHGINDSVFDFVYSSHCLEHMRDVPTALQNWTRVLKPGGYMYIVVPDFYRYEKGTWPSTFNPDHKASFSFLSDLHETRATHYTLPRVLRMAGAMGLSVVYACEEYDGYDAALPNTVDQTLGNAVAQILYIFRKDKR